jgi:hypothetical protein
MRCAEPDRGDATACTLCAFLHLDCQVTVNYETFTIVTSVRVTIVDVAKQAVLHVLSVCVGSFIYSTCKAHDP